MKNQTVKGIYTCLEMLTAAGRDDLHDWWCSLLYAANGDINYAAWTVTTLNFLENDVIYRT